MAQPPEDSGVLANNVDRTVTGPARVGSPRELAARARPGDVLVIDVMDLREADADALSRTGAAAVINAQRTASGRQPAAGARRLLGAGLTVIDGAGAAILAVRDGAMLTVAGDRVLRGAAVVATGTTLTPERVAAADTAALDHLRVQVAVFGSRALERLEREASLFFEGAGLPRLDVEGRVVLVVCASESAGRDLKALRLFMADRRPVVIAEGGAVDACVECGVRPAVVVGQVEQASRSVLAHARVIALAPDRAAVHRLEAERIAFEDSDVALAGADLAVLAAHHAGAEVVVVVGGRRGAVDVLSADPELGVGGFLTALVTQRRAVSAEVLAATYRHRHSLAFVWWVMTLAVATLGVALWSVDGVRDAVSAAWSAVSGWFGGGA